MSNVGYDLDTSGGLMPLIKALIKPPDEDLSVQKPKKPQHPYYKRPGKGHNHDSCDACGEGGDLICCDRCPASFHLGCYDPPLDENDIPAGLWLCRECRASDENKPTSSRSSRAQSPVDSKSDTEKKTRSLRNNRTNSKKKSKDEDEEVKPEVDEENEAELTPMEILVKAARIMNPRQFELPREMRIPCLFPGTDKEGSKNGNASVVTVDSWGCVPLPAKSCFVCQGTCKNAPLLQCDYCPLLFHQDCLDPPLTALPTGRWMCPNHVEQYIDWKLVKSVSATERVALWEQFSGPVDQHAVKVDFIRRARTHNPMFRVKVPVGVRGRAAVPALVRHHYRRPPPLPPSRREYVRCNNVINNLKATGVYSSSEEEEEGPKHTICMNLQCPQYSGTGACAAAAAPPLAPPPASAPEPEPPIHHAPHTLDGHTASSSDLSDSDFEYFTASVKRRKVSCEDRSPGKRGRTEKLELRSDEDVEQLLAVVDEQLKKLDERLVKLLAWQRLQQVLVGERCFGAWSGAVAGAAASAARAVAAAVGGGAARARLQRLGLRPAPAPAPLPSELLSRSDRERIARRVWGAPPPRAPPSPPSRSPGHSLSDACVRATLCAVRPAASGAVGAVGAVGMRGAVLAVGAASGCDVRLDAAACRRVSHRHAIIFHDEVSGQFELINYSEYGTCVNGIMYACDLSVTEHRRGERGEVRPAGEGEGNAPAPTAATEADIRANALRDIVSHRVPQTIRLNGDLTKPLRTEATREACACASGGAGAAAGAVAGAWEGSALVPHGALIQFGCLAYVFSITDARAFPYEQDTDPPAL